LPYPILLIRVVLPYSSNTYIRTPCFVYVYTYPILLTRIFLPYSFIHNLSPFKLYADSHILYYTQIRTFVYTYSSQIVKYVYIPTLFFLYVYTHLILLTYTHILTLFFQYVRYVQSNTHIPVYVFEIRIYAPYSSYTYIRTLFFLHVYPYPLVLFMMCYTSGYMPILTPYMCYTWSYMPILTPYMIHKHVQSNTEWWWLIGCLKLQVIFRKRATNYRALLRKMTCQDKAPYHSTPPCS